MFALSPSFLARLCKSAYFMESKSIFDAPRSDFIEARALVENGVIAAARPLKFSRFKPEQQQRFLLAVAFNRKFLQSNQKMIFATTSAFEFATWGRYCALLANFIQQF